MRSPERALSGPSGSGVEDALFQAVDDPGMSA